MRIEVNIWYSWKFQYLFNIYFTYFVNSDGYIWISFSFIIQRKSTTTKYIDIKNLITKYEASTFFINRHEAIQHAISRYRSAFVSYRLRISNTRANKRHGGLSFHLIKRTSQLEKYLFISSFLYNFIPEAASSPLNSIRARRLLLLCDPTLLAKNWST